MTIPLVDLKAQYNSIRGEIDTAIQRVLQNGQFILAFEEKMAAYCGTKLDFGGGKGEMFQMW